jgi:hypothetical protein
MNPKGGKLRESRAAQDGRYILSYYQADRLDSYRDHALWLLDFSGKYVTKRTLSDSIAPWCFSRDGQYMASVDLTKAAPPYPGLDVLDKEANGPIRLWRIVIGSKKAEAETEKGTRCP